MTASLGGETHRPGDPGRKGTVPLAVPVVGDLERRYVLEAVESGFVSSVGPFVTQFEQVFADYVGARHAVACASGTTALHVALQIVGVSRGDDVACSDFTFIGSANPVAYLSARPLLVDSERRSWNLDPDLLRAELERRRASQEPMPAAVEAVHVLGHPAEIAPLVELCEEFDIPLVEDAAESLGATWTDGPYAGRHTGTVGLVGCFSFNGNKIATTGGGGMIVTDDDDLARRARHLTTQAKVPDVGYLHDEVGSN
jgi:dTDP-4-amino-4,6-dideoxygalactose transaminase